MSWEMDLNDDMLEELYEWIDRIPLSRQKKRIERDFADGYCVAEIIKNSIPEYIEIHNFTPAHNLQQKMANWGLLNAKVFSKFGLNVPHTITQNICNCKPGYIEVFLYNLRYKLEEKMHEISLKQSREKENKSPRSSNFSPTSFKSSRGGNKKADLQMRLEYEEKVQQCLQQAEQLEVLQAKVRRLEHLLELKEARVEDLTQKLLQYRPTGENSKNDQPTLLKTNRNQAQRKSILV